VVDDGSTDETQSEIQSQFPWASYIRGNGNLWWSGATNEGLRRVLQSAKPGDYVLTLNNDTILPPDYFEVLARSIADHPNALIGSVALDHQMKDVVVEAGVDISWLTAKFKYNARDLRYAQLKLNGASYYEPTVLPGRGTAIPVSVFHRIGLFDAEVFPQYGADYDFSLRAKKAGFKLIVSYGLRLYCFPKLSGIADTGERVPLGQALRSFASIRSGNNLATRFRFAVRHAPRWLLPSFILADTMRVIVGTLLKRTRLW
jgi:GT2 family glycosyltransferase